MEKNTYLAEKEVLSHHWWFVGRRLLFRKILSKYKIIAANRILDVGISAGTNLMMLRDMGSESYVGLDLNRNAIMACQEAGLGPIVQGDACLLPFASNQLDAVLATDVIEHLDEDVAAVKEFFRILKPGGMLLLTVPAFELLWGLQDDVSHHKRRYIRKNILKILEQAGFSIPESFYFNFILFLPILVARGVIKLFSIKVASENAINNDTVNKILKVVFRWDIALSRIIHPPFGVSILAVAIKPEKPL